MIEVAVAIRSKPKHKSSFYIVSGRITLSAFLLFTAFSCSVSNGERAGQLGGASGTSGASGTAATGGTGAISGASGSAATAGVSGASDSAGKADTADASGSSAGVAGASQDGSSSNGRDASVGIDSAALDAAGGATRTQAPYPPAKASDCGGWALVDNVCCAQYCSNDNKSEDCSSCGGVGSEQCTAVSSKACISGQWPQVESVGDNEPWHYSRSTHYGLTYAGACAFGLYGLCTTEFDFLDATLAAKCEAFCSAYPDLCRDPATTSLRGNFAAPQGNYYTQFWSSLEGDRDNYLSCGECFEVERTQKDGTEYQPGQPGYTKPIVIQIADSCPCSANSKWCCGSGRDHCGEVSDFKYGCPLPPGPPDPPSDHDPLPDESIHLDLSDIAMARLQTGDANGAMVDGVIPIKYKRVPCPVVGNAFIWFRGGSEYWFSLSVVNTARLGSVVKVEAQLPSGDWVSLQRDPNYTSARPQERYGSWTIPQGAGPFLLPVSLRITDPSGRAIVANQAIDRWPDPTTEPEGYYIDTGVQF